MATGAIPFEMQREPADFPGTTCDIKMDGSDGCRWCYINSLALGLGSYNGNHNVKNKETPGKTAFTL